MAGFRDDERTVIHDWLLQIQAELATDDWEQRALVVETMAALAAWRSRPILVRVQTIADWLTVFSATPDRKRGSDEF